jgi:hypothetical protein
LSAIWGSSAATAPTPEGDKAVNIPLAPRAARALDLTIKERARRRTSWRMGGGWTGMAPLGSVHRADHLDLLAAV